MTGSSSEIVYEALPVDDPQIRQPDITRARQLLGWEPEIQLEDNQKARDSERCGWMYQLYKPANDPKTGKPLDATKPVGEWNHVHVVIAPPPAKSEVAVNGVSGLAP